MCGLIIGGGCGGFSPPGGCSPPGVPPVPSPRMQKQLISHLKLIPGFHFVHLSSKAWLSFPTPYIFLSHSSSSSSIPFPHLLHIPLVESLGHILSVSQTSPGPQSLLLSQQG